MDDKFAKREISLRYWLQGKGFHMALEAMDFAKGFHTGLRRDGVTPEFDHQVSIGHYVRTLESSLIFAEQTFATIFLHDVREDFDVPDAEIRNRFGDRVADAVDAMTKTFRGVKRPAAEVFQRIGDDPRASVAKGADRGHNHRSMVGVFSLEKQVEYLAETKEFFLPMLKRARRAFPRQEPAYENIKHVLTGEIELIEAIHAAMRAEPADAAPGPTP
ncbi:HD domain-containing protein [Cereibacter sphaeroides]|uniref:HD domain-containing protein n=1 Tax=Cereibacter sphaeroides TaxID=1063 RepID=UPI001F348C83|nr:HD domain-containing protein [Cereibacter sphaeroides]MCE6958063.1 HD domain-containing protein [Cereibacter sphaeroides]MCE6971344.1 HD domain-containing protein [Cereibacter sphaeroides]